MSTQLILDQVQKKLKEMTCHKVSNLCIEALLVEASQGPYLKTQR